MSNRSAAGTRRETGAWQFAPSRWALLALVVAGKGLDSLSTVVVLSLRDDVYETMWLTRTLMDELGLVAGNLAVFALAVVSVALFAESGRAIARVAPDPWVPGGYAVAFRTVSYCGATAWYGSLGVHNFSLLV